MAYRFIFKANAQKEFENLTQGQRKAIADRLKALNDSLEGKALDRYAPLRRVKAGDARVIYNPKPDAKGRLAIWKVGIDHSIYDLDELFREFLSEGQKADD